MASGGDLGIAIGIQDLTGVGIARILQQLKKVPGGMQIAIEATTDLSAIRNARNEMDKAAKHAAELNSKLNEKVGTNWLTGALADAKRYDANIRNLDKSLSRLSAANNKMSINGILSNFGRLDQKGQGDWIERIAERTKNLQAELKNLRAKGELISPSNTQAVKAHEREVANLTNRLQQYIALQQKMQSINNRQARTIATNQQRLNASDLLVQRTTHGSATQGLLVGYDKKTLSERKSILTGLIKQPQKLQTELNLKNASRNTIDKSDTQAVKAHEAAVKALIDRLKQLGQARKSAERMDKQIAREEARAFAKMQQSERSVASAIARNQGVFDKASFNEYMRHFKTFSQEGQRSALRGVINDRINVKGTLDAETRKLQGIDPSDTQAIAAQEQKVAQLRAQYSALTNQILQMRNAMDATDKNTTRGVERLSKSFERINASMSKNRLKNLLNQFKGLDATNQLRVFDRITQKVNEVQQKLANLSAKGKTINPNDTQAVNAHVREVTRLTQRLNALTNAQARMRNAMDATARRNEAQAMREASQAAARYRAELNGVQVAMRSTSQFASQMREDIQQAFSYYALKQFLSNLIEIGGQFEYQRRAIANILQDGTKANVLFNQIKELGVKSPFSTLDLDKYAKQLSAFDIPYHKMFDTLKKLADISAGTGADMSRIILAYGHVKSEGFLTGVQRRQFSNANINIVGGLSDYYTKQEGQQVTKRDVYKRIHDKQVSFEDMETVLLSMAEEGGQFYNMQEVMASTVKGVYKNLDDAINHMYMSIEKSANGPLMFFGKTLTGLISLVEQFPGAASRFITAAVAMAGIRALNAATINKEAVATVKRIALLDKEVIATNKVAIANAKAASAMETGAKATASTTIGKSSLFGGQALTVASAQNIANTIKLGNAEGVAMKQAVLHGIARRQLNKELAIYLIRVGAITAAEARAALTSRTLWGTITAGAKAAAASIKSLLLSIWPMLAIWGAFEGVMWVYNKIVDTEGEERKKAMVDALKDSYNSLKREMEQLPKTFDHMYTDEIFQSIKDMTDSVKDNLADSEMILGRVFAKDANGEYLHNTLQQATALRGEMERAFKIKEDMYKKDIISQFIPNDTSGDFFGIKWNDFPSFWKYVEKLRRDYENGITEAIRSNLYIDKIEEIKANPEYKELSDYEIVKKIVSESTNYGGYLERLNFDYLSSLNFFDTYLNDLGKTWIKLAKAHGYTKDEDILSVLSMAVDAQTELDDRGKKYVMDYFTKTFYPALYKGPSDGNVTVPNAIYDAINKKLEELRNLVDESDRSRFRSFSIQRTDTLSQMYEAFLSDYKNLNEKFEKAYKDTDLLKGFITRSDIKNPKKILKKSDDPKINKAIEDWNKDVERRNTLIAAAAEAGYDLTVLKKGISNGRGSKDSRLEELQTRFRLLKEAAQAYKQWSKEFGSNIARDYLSGHPEFNALFQDWSVINFDDMSNLLTSELNAVADELEATEDRRRLKLQWNVEIDNQNKNDAIETLGTEIKNLQEHINKSSLRYNIYTAMFNATGSHEQASMFAFGAPSDRLTKGDYIKRNFDYRLQMIGRSETYDSLSKMTEKELLSIPPKVVDEFRKAKKSVEGWEQSMDQAYIELLKKDESYIKKQNAINAEFTNAVDAIFNSKSANPDDAGNLFAQSLTRRELALKQAELEQIRFFEQIDKFGNSTALKHIEELLELLNKAKELGIITPTQYQENINKINRGKDQIRNAGILGIGPNWSAFIRGGLPGLMSKVKSDYETTDADKRSKSTEKLYKFFFGENGTGGYKKTEQGLKDFNDALDDSAKAVSNMASFMNDFFGSLGNNTAAGVASDVGTVAGGITSGMSALSSLGVWGQAAGAALGLVSGIAKQHDAKLDRAIKRSQQRVKDLKSEYKLLDNQIKRSFYTEDGKQAEKLDSLKKQSVELNKQINLENDKKKKDEDAIRTMKEQYAELNEQIKYYWSDLLKELYGIDFGDYAKRLGDALTEAFKNGEDAAIAWRKTVGDIVREVANEMIVANFIKPMFDELWNKAFGKEGEGGVLSGKSTLSESDIKWLGDELMALSGDGVIGKAEAVFKAIEQAFPYSSDSESTGSLTRIGQNNTEETGSTVASYLNTIRADVSVNRRQLNEIVQKALPALSHLNIIAQAQLVQLGYIVDNTRRSADAASEILSVLNKVTLGDKEFYVK